MVAPVTSSESQRENYGERIPALTAEARAKAD